eukprot:58955_1
MHFEFIFGIAVIIVCIHSDTIHTQQEIDALKDIYLSTNGQNWRNKWNVTALENGNICTPPLYGIICTNSTVTEIKLSNNSLSGTIPSTIGNLTQLMRLFLADNLLSGTIPISITSLMQ